MAFCCTGQEPAIPKIKIKKTSNDSIGIWLPPMMKAEDTLITYSNLRNAKTLVIQINSSAYVHIIASLISFDIQINNGPKKLIKGNQFDFKKLTQLASGGKITLSNCLISYVHGSTSAVFLVLPDKRITVLP